MRIALVLSFAMLATASGCCHFCKCEPCHEAKPAACHVCSESPDVAVVRSCVDACQGPDCVSGCCHRLSLVQGSDEERAALRSCIRECSTP